MHSAARLAAPRPPLRQRAVAPRAATPQGPRSRPSVAGRVRRAARPGIARTVRSRPRAGRWRQTAASLHDDAAPATGRERATARSAAMQSRVRRAVRDLWPNLERTRLQPLQTGSLGVEPLLETRRIVQPQAVQRQAAPAREGRFDEAGAQIILGQTGVERDACIELQKVAFGPRHLRGAAFAQAREFAARVAPASRLVQRRPQQIDDARSRQRFAACEQRQQRERLANRDRQRRTVAQQAHGPEQFKRQHRRMMRVNRRRPQVGKCAQCMRSGKRHAAAGTQVRHRQSGAPAVVWRTFSSDPVSRGVHGSRRALRPCRSSRSIRRRAPTASRKSSTSCAATST